MEETFRKLTERLLQRNSRLSVTRARTWVELLWEDFETTYAKAGHDYRGKELTEKMVTQLIDSYGTKLHEFAARNPKYKHLLDDSNDITH
ncbi:YfhJ family protein [Domibacillus sp. A3M-37]|uniref:YfhJ family protein n=1 Tax=Domibacillus TaxID=1433999 RepID=UPI0006182345|nr:MULTISPECIES: YfhJ family protein [Domibacillus]MCP3762120.1 YfhJ family protein [Domibacillus sp. A3M-37]